MNSTVGVTITVVAALALLILVDARCLVDLARTSDAELRYLNRSAWALVIIVSFPIGPMLYLTYAKGPRRRA